MLTCQGDVIRRAHEVGDALPPEQKVALGVALIRLVNQPEDFAIVRRAARLIDNQAVVLLSDAIRINEQSFHTSFEPVTIGTTHGPNTDRHPGGRGTAGPSRSRALLPSLRAAWATIRDAERRLSDSIFGDFLALASVFILFAALPWIGWALMAEEAFR